MKKNNRDEFELEIRPHLEKMLGYGLGVDVCKEYFESENLSFSGTELAKLAYKSPLCGSVPKEFDFQFAKALILAGLWFGMSEDDRKYWHERYTKKLLKKVEMGGRAASVLSEMEDDKWKDLSIFPSLKKEEYELNRIRSWEDESILRALGYDPTREKDYKASYRTVSARIADGWRRWVAGYYFPWRPDEDSIDDYRIYGICEYDETLRRREAGLQNERIEGSVLVSSSWNIPTGDGITLVEAVLLREARLLKTRKVRSKKGFQDTFRGLVDFKRYTKKSFVDPENNKYRFVSSVEFFLDSSKTELVLSDVNWHVVEPVFNPTKHGVEIFPKVMSLWGEK